jgi:oligopeptide/dipeptide ABC transporter ATP-binding protein
LPDADAFLSVENLKKHFVKRDLFGREVQRLRAVDGVSFEVGRGEALGIVGESGCGKTTTAMMIMRLIEPTSGRVRLDGRDLTGLTGEQLRAVRPRFQMVFQDPGAALDPRMTVYDALEEPFRIQRKRATPDVIEGLMHRVGLDGEHLERFAHELSGGQKQRLVIARALAMEPALLVLDEPTSSLDVNVQAQILNLLGNLRRQMGLTYVLISHNLGVVRHVADRVAVMYLGRIVEVGPVGAVFASPLHPYTRALFSAIPSVRGGGERIVLEGDVPNPLRVPSGCRFRTRCPHSSPECSIGEPELTDRGNGHFVACSFA